MKKILLSAFALFGMNCFGQTILFEDSFESYDDFIIANIGNWIVVDVDLLPTYGFQGATFANTQVAKSFQVFNSTTTTPPLTPTAASNWSARTGSKAAVCFAAVPSETVLANNDWLITPQITLGATNNVLKFWAKSCDTAFGNERFTVGVSTTGADPADFTIISPGSFVLNPATAMWIEYTYNLDNYQGQNVRISINCVSVDQFGFAIDDFSVTTGTLSSDNFFAKNLAIYPSPASDVLNLSSNTTQITEIQISDLNGRVVAKQSVNSLESTQVNVSSLTSGVYLVSVTTSNGVGTSKFIKN